MDEEDQKPTVEPERTESKKGVSTGKEAETPENSKLIGFEDFLKIDLRVAQILEAEPIEKSNKLIKLQISLGEELGERQIVAGIAKHFNAEELIGRLIVVVANLKPAKLMGETSEGMLLAASDETQLSLLSPGSGLTVGSRVG